MANQSVYTYIMDKVSPEKRSWTMAKVKSRDTRPEKIMRSLLHSMGYRFRLHRMDLPGKPDIVLPKYKAVVFVHGCFWHRHQGCKRATTPASNSDYWNPKFARTITRDAKNQSLLKASGWRVLVIWECELKKPAALRLQMSNFLSNRN